MPVLPDYGDAKDPRVRAKYAYLQSGICLVGNAFLFSSKLYLAIVWSSVAVLGDALNHLADVAVSILILAVFRLASKEADEEHPYGHGRLEHILAIVVASMVIFMGITILRESMERLSNPTIVGSLLFTGLMVVFAVIKAFMAALTFAVAKRIDSNAMKADAWNHTTDVLISLSIGAAIYVTTLGSQYRILDPIFGLVVAGLVIYAGIELIRGSAGVLMGGAPSEELVKGVKSAALKVKGVRDVHEIEVHDYGPHKMVSLHVVVDEHITAQEAHDIATGVEESIMRATDCEVTAHTEVTEPKLDVAQIEKLVRDSVRIHRAVKECVDVSVVPYAEGGVIFLTVAVDGNLSVLDTHHIVRELEERIRVLLPHYNAIARAVPYRPKQRP